MFDVCCRMCLENAPLSDIQSLYDRHNNFTIRDKIYELFQIKFSDTEKLSTVCNRCLQKIETADSIRSFFLESNDKFKKIILGYPKLTTPEPDAEEIHEPDTEQLSTDEKSPDDAKEIVKLEPQDSTADIMELGDLEDIPGNQDQEFEEHVVFIEEALDELSNSSAQSEDSVYEDGIVTTLVYKTDQQEDHLSEAEVDLSLGAQSDDEQPNTILADEQESNENNESLCLDDQTTSVQPDKENAEADSVDKKEFSDSLEEEFSIVTIEFECNVCHEVLEDRVALQSHNDAKHSREYPHSCKHCLMVFKTVHYLKSHVCVEQPRPFRCSECADCFPTVKNLRIHTRDKHRDRHSCKHCPKVFKTVPDLKAHICTERPRPFPCPECTDYFATIADLRAHTRDKHPVPVSINKATTHKCAHCSCSYLSKTTLAKHVKESHTTQPSTFPCEHCEKTFSSPQSVRAHSLFHDKKYECSFCGKLCPTAVALAGHENTHTKERPFECCVCFRNFAQYNSMRRHMKIHLGEKSYSCDLCSKRFRQRSVMVTHRRIHTGEKPFTCPVCLKAFRDHSTFAKHKKLHDKIGRKRSAGASSVILEIDAPLSN